MKVWELRTEQVTMICVPVGVRRERRENLAGEREVEDREGNNPSGHNERRKPTVLFGQGTEWKSSLGISR